MPGGTAAQKLSSLTTWSSLTRSTSRSAAVVRLLSIQSNMICVSGSDSWEKTASHEQNLSLPGCGMTFESEGRSVKNANVGQATVGPLPKSMVPPGPVSGGGQSGGGGQTVP